MITFSQERRYLNAQLKQWIKLFLQFVTYQPIHLFNQIHKLLLEEQSWIFCINLVRCTRFIQ